MKDHRAVKAPGASTSHMTQNNAPLVSVIIPAFNSGEWLAQAIDSALGQSYPNVEIVVVNDGSTDLSAREIAHRYIPLITYIERENGGVAAARNTGINASNGELIALLDQDDVWLPHKLEVEVRAWLAHPHVALVHSSYHLIDEQGKRVSTLGDQKWLSRLREREYRPLPDLLVDVPICSATTLFPRKILDEVGLLDPMLSGTDDWDLWLRMAARGYPFYYIGEPLAEYRTHTANTSRNIDLMVSGVLRTLDKFYALPSIPKSALHYQTRAYFNRHAWAASLYYGAGRIHNAQHHLRLAARYYPQGLATGRLLQSLVYAQQPQPNKADAEAAIRFVYKTLSNENLPSTIKRRLRSRAQLVLALHAGRQLEIARRVAYILLGNPHLFADHELWSVGRRLLSRIIGRFKARITGQRETA